MLEEAAIDGIPAICIDPKGDLGNLLLTFPNLAPRDFAGWWMAARRSARAFPSTTTPRGSPSSGRAGLAEWDQQPERIQKFREAADVAIYTPGSDSGLPLSILQSLAPPAPELLADGSALAERIGSVVSGPADAAGPRRGSAAEPRPHPAFEPAGPRLARGPGSGLATLVALVQKPPLDKLGALDLETILPRQGAHGAGAGGQCPAGLTALLHLDAR